MAASAQDVIDCIESRRVQLQANVDKLQKALSHWTTWEAEYEMLKEEIQSAEDPSPSKIREIARDLDVTLVNEKEIQELLGKDPQSPRSANQIVDMITRRIDYVQQNSATIEKQLDTAEKQLAGVDVLLEPGMDNEEGLPMMDIEEELDEEGNEVSSSVNQTGKGAAELIEVLRKAGLQKAEMDEKNAARAQRLPENVNSSSTPSQTIADSTTTAPVLAKSPPEESHPSPSASSNIEATTSIKSVSFTEDTKPESSKRQASPGTDGHKEDLATINFSNGAKIVELDEDDDMLVSEPMIPRDESPEDAELRRQMLQYGLSEVGQVVAELDLDRPTASYSDDDSDDYDDYNTEDEEDEDEYGRSTRPVLTEDYRRQMMELEKKLNARMLENVGPQPNDDSLAEHIGDIRTMRIRKDDEFDQALETSLPEPPKAEPTEGAQKKGVRWADSLDISDPPQAERARVEPAFPAPAVTPTISDTIVERSAPQAPMPTAQNKPAKVSRFKSARSGSNGPPQMLPTPPLPEAPPVPTGPTGRTLASTITEHVPTTSEPNPPDEFDPVIINREIQAQYHKARNKFIGQQDGFKPTEADEESPIVEERDGKTKKVSRFMAARLKADGM